MVLYKNVQEFLNENFAGFVLVRVIDCPCPLSVSQVDPSIRSMMALQQERGTTLFADPHNDVAQKSSTQLLEDQADIVKWSRVPGQVRHSVPLSAGCFKSELGCLKFN